ncbi:FMN-dependent NADH-azoreductase [Jeotgalibaca arthritidis]|uniref:FMN dependent NADH:quinone oxidoreductase n=1 Tax=Jeotgalibaca arthritidis TaxID=1868794 RepID=A0A6G7K9W0_9LACT|nr:FMN-dependent NADH-azoreductase [Jeotgalibaca arthritidis]QII82053.1 FMN-dependent NADH-azoreductase [Jeotgalibaca arthritidis]
MNILIVKANDRPATESISSRMFETFYEEVKNNEKLDVTVYDIYKEDMPYIGQDLFGAFGKMASGEALTAAEEAVVAANQKARDAFTAADVVVIAFPLWNLTIPAKLQTFIDYIFAGGYTFKYDETGKMVALLPDKKVILMNARGGVYSTNEMQAMEMSVNYLRNVFAGIFQNEIIDEIIIEGHNKDPERAQEIIETGLEKVRQAARNLG